MAIPQNSNHDDFIVFGPDDVDLSRSPLRGHFPDETYVLGAFNPGLTRLPNGNLLAMVRVAEALRRPFEGDCLRTIRWADGRYVLDRHKRDGLNEKDPRQILLTAHHYKTMVLTSLSWLLPVELTADGSRVVAAHYDKVVHAEQSYQSYGVEDARISRIDGRWWMTTCSVSAERHCTTLHVSHNGLDYRLQGIVLDHQNKDMLLFEGKVGAQFMALTRPLGELYFAYPPDSPYLPGPSIQLASSPDLLHWRPLEGPGIRPRKANGAAKVGGGTPPILTPNGWLTFYHAVEQKGVVGAYRTFWALLERDDPTHILRLEDTHPLLTAWPDLTLHLDPLRYVQNIVFTTGAVEHGDALILASGEDDLCCRITRIPRARFL